MSSQIKRPEISILLAAAILLLTACQPAAEGSSPTAPPLPSPTTPSETAVPTFTLTPSPTFVPPTPRETPLDLPAGITLEEYALAGPPDGETRAFQPVQGTQDDVLLRRAAERDYRSQYVAAANRTLAPYGYRIEKGQSPEDEYRLYHNDQLLLEQVVYVGPVSVGTQDFILTVEASDATYLLNKDGLIPRDGTRDVAYGDYAAYLGADLITAKETYSGTGEAMTGSAIVYRDGVKIFSISTGRPSPSPDLYGLWTYGDHWAIEIKGHVIVDGQPLNAAKGYQEIFGFQLLHGAPFYFFQKDGKIGAVYDGQPLSLDYDELPHYGCCAASGLNPGHAENMVWLFARRGGVWYYIELGVYS